MRVEYLVLLLGLSGAAQAAGNSESNALPDAELLEFMADWQDEDQDWLDAQMLREMADEQSAAATKSTRTAQEKGNE